MHFMNVYFTETEYIVKIKNTVDLSFNLYLKNINSTFMIDHNSPICVFL